VNFIIWIYSHFDMVCSYVGPFWSTYHIESASFGYDEFHTSEFHHMDL